MSWLSSIKLPRWLCFRKDLNSPGDYIRMYEADISKQIYSALETQGSSLAKKLDAETIVSYIMDRLDFLPTVAKLVIHAALHGVADRVVSEIGGASYSVIVQRIMDILRKLK